MSQWFCDWLPYYNAVATNQYRDLYAANAADWSNLLAMRADAQRRFGVIANGQEATWSAVGAVQTNEALAELILIPTFYGATGVFINGTVGEAQVRTSDGTLRLFWSGTQRANVALPASVWRSASDFNSAWLRLRYDVATLTVRVRCWSTSEPEPTTWNATYTHGVNIQNTGVPRIGYVGSTIEQAIGFVAWGATLAPSPRRASDPRYYDAWLALAHEAGGDMAGRRRVLVLDSFVQAQSPPSFAVFTATMRAATEGYDAGAAYPHASVRYPGLIAQWPTFTRSLPDSIVGRQAIANGQIVLSNPNGANDNWTRALNLNMPIVLRYGEPSWPIYDLQPVFVGEITGVSAQPGSITLAVRDGMSRFDRLLEEGLLSTGRAVPRALGDCYNVNPPLIDAANLIYKLSKNEIEAVTAGRDRGVLLTTINQTWTGYSAASDAIVFPSAHKLLANETVTVSGSELPGGLAAGNYFVKTVLATDRVTLAATLGGATIDLTGNDTGDRFPAAVYPVSNLIDAGAVHNLVANQRIAFATAAPPPMVAGTPYFVIASGLTATAFKLSATQGGAEIDITGDTKTISAVNAATDVITMSANHGWAVNDGVTVEGAPPAPLTANTLYYVQAVPAADQLKLSLTQGGAAIDLTGTTTGATLAKNLQTADANTYKFNRVMSFTLTVAAYSADTAAGQLTLRSNPAGQLTFDIKGERTASTYANTAAHAVRVLLGDNVGVDDAFRRGALWTHTIGTWESERTSLADVLDKLAAAGVDVWGVNRIGTFVARDIDATPAIAINLDRETMAEPEIASKRMPAQTNVIGGVFYRVNHTVQNDADLAGSVSPTDRLLYSREHFLSSGVSATSQDVDNGTQGARLPATTYTSIGANTGSAYRFPGKQTISVRFRVAWTALDRWELGRRVSPTSARAVFTASGASSQQGFVTSVSENFQDGTQAITIQLPINAFVPNI